MSTLTCTICGSVKTMEFGDGLSRGWPKCHEQTMRLGPVSRQEIEKGVTQAMKPLTLIRKALKEGKT